ncbi:hypothetical protein MP228_008452 [Amoeboaphelidium protococcarum]|nr:hypothetical protein MP228_008452 [Amoeboaphelidium protococcarum]
MSVSDINPNMREYWYALSESRNLRRGDIVSLYLLGDPICLYRNDAGVAVALADRCAHRSAPLSIGFMENGELRCKYHGWQYDVDGQCTEIPAKLGDRNIPANAKVYKYPLVERDGLIWVWPGAKELADESKIQRTATNYHDPKSFTSPFVSTIDLNIDFSLMVENLLDPAHIPFTHDGTIGKRSMAKPIEMKDMKVAQLSEFVPGNDSHKVITGIVQAHGEVKSSRFIFVPPCTILLQHNIKPGWLMNQTMHCTPTKEGHMRLIYSHARSFIRWAESVPVLSLSYNSWISTKIVFQDYELLHGQQARLSQGAKAWHSPIQVDGLPKLFREWLRKAMTNDYNAKMNVTDDYACVTYNGPYFRQWKQCQGGSKQTEDIEDLTLDKSVLQQPVDDFEWMHPHQYGVDNSAYTWRKDVQLGRSTSISQWFGFWFAEQFFTGKVFKWTLLSSLLIYGMNRMAPLLLQQLNFHY